jgi:hypothetical protein
MVGCTHILRVSASNDINVSGGSEQEAPLLWTAKKSLRLLTLRVG